MHGEPQETDIFSRREQSHLHWRNGVLAIGGAAVAAAVLTDEAELSIIVGVITLEWAGVEEFCRRMFRRGRTIQT